MARDTVNAVGDASATQAFSWRRLFGLHDHAYGPWEQQFAVPLSDGQMSVLSVRECTHCKRVETRRDVLDIPASGIPFHLRMPTYQRAPRH